MRSPTRLVLTQANTRARAQARGAGGVRVHAPTRTWAVHHPQDRETPRRCGGVDGRANVGHMPGSCLHVCVCARVAARQPRTRRARSRRRMPHAGGMCKQGFMPARLPLKGVLPHGDVSTGAEASDACEPRRRRTEHILCAQGAETDILISRTSGPVEAPTSPF